ncbi:MAG: diguanylate cyclase [Thioalkalispiraceae bacterium]|jgi:diguanylate cyclase (GGDEF)-like protein
MKPIVFLILLMGYYFTSLSAYAQPLDLADHTQDAIGHRAEVLLEGKSPRSMSAALEAYYAGWFQPATQEFLNFGIGAQPRWLHFRIDNSTSRTLLRRLSIKTAWLDKLEVYFIQEGNLVKAYQVGDTLPFEQRPVESRYFDIDYEYPPGSTTLLLRVDSTDPMVLPIFLRKVANAHADNVFESYFYGFIYGTLIALMAYNLMLFITLRGMRYLFYALYLLSFILMNLAYTGHGFQWFWSNAIQWQLWSNPVLMIVFSVSGLAFATIFLETRKRIAGLHQLVVMNCLLAAMALFLSIILNSQYAALIVAFTFVLIFSFGMVLLGGMSLYRGNRSAKYFLIASITHVSMTSVTAMTVWGLVPYTTLGYRAIEIAMVIDAILLSLALADQLRIINEGKIKAEHLAMTDHLTGISNRRSFYERVKPLWNTGQRKQRNMSVMLLDIDEFKTINDTYGHAVGDEVLIHLARCLLDNIRAGDIVARWSGDEFIVFLPETSIDEATEIAERFREIIEQSTIHTDKGDTRFTTSIGIAHNVVVDMDINALIRVADISLYKAKQQGRNKVFARHISE